MGRMKSWGKKMLTDVILNVLIYNSCVIITYFYLGIFRNQLKIKGKQVKCVGNLFLYWLVCFSWKTFIVSLLTFEKAVSSTAFWWFYPEVLNCLLDKAKIILLKKNLYCFLHFEGYRDAWISYFFNLILLQIQFHHCFAWIMASTGKDKMPTTKPQLSWYDKNTDFCLRWKQIQTNGSKINTQDTCNLQNSELDLCVWFLQ